MPTEPRPTWKWKSLRKKPQFLYLLLLFYMTTIREKFNMNLFIQLVLFYVAVYSAAPQTHVTIVHHKQKTLWLKHLLAKRSPPDFTLYATKRPCPRGCNCNYDTINCNDLVTHCAECEHWHQIDINQIECMRPRSFHHFKFAPNRTTHLIFYKLLNSTVGAHTFEDMLVEENARIEITFQYNSMIKFDRHALRGLRMRANSTVVFNFPYTSQVVFAAQCFDGVLMHSEDVKIIVRVLKSFSVRFLGNLGNDG